MSPTELSLADLAGMILGFFLTLLIFSYLLGDNPLFRLTIHVFIGVAAGYAGIVAIYNVILPRLLVPFVSGSRGEQALALVPLLLSMLLLARLSPRLARLGNVSVAYLVGVAAAAAIGGAVSGTLFPQVDASFNLFDLQTIQESGQNVWFQLVNNSIILLGTVTTLAYFHFSERVRSEEASFQQAGMDGVRQVGQVFIAVTFGVLFAGAYAASLAALVERLHFLVNFVRPLLDSIF